MKQIIYSIIASIFLTSCGDSDSEYVTSINNNSSYEIIVKFSEDSTILCLPNQETVIEAYWGSSVKKMSCMTPYIFSNDIAEFTINEDNKILVKDIKDDKNWTCTGEEKWDLIMVGSYYSKIKTTLTVVDADIKDSE